MSHDSIAQPPNPKRHLTLGILVTALLIGLAAAPPAAAQNSQPDSSRAGEVGSPHGRMIRFAAVEGPPAPAFMRDSIQVTGKQLQQYTQRYDSHMRATQPLRDSLRTSMQAARAAFEKGDRSEAHSRRDAVQSQWKRLADQDKKFNQDLKNVLTKEQQTRYQQWKDNRKEEDRRRWREHRADRRGGWHSHQDSTRASRPSSDSDPGQGR